LIADSLRMLPKKESTGHRWSATEWAETRKGWIFLTSKPSEREAIRPLRLPRLTSRFSEFVSELVSVFFSSGNK